MAQQGFLGEIRIFAGNFAPRSWALCEGQLLSIAQNTALFSILGTIYGGDGRTTFALPDLRGRRPISSGTGPGLSTYREGVRAGQETVTLNILQIPAHNHNAQGTIAGNVNIASNTETANSGEAAGNVLGEAGANIYNNAAAEPSELLGGVSHNLSASVQMGNTGGNLDHENRMPFLAINYIISTQGTFPSRN
ncbi:phage tail protein [Lewinella cohaerens]|uniref:phage tail protein n=1 Tax=Lewinella cohaerens TaxID=70995 RepID=UPI00036BEAB5|nr:tail fiber protein [Lewinella cohaerens]